MDGMTLILFLCICVPILPVLVLLPDKRSRLFLGYLLIGVAVCLVAAEVNALLLGLFHGNIRYVTTNYTPMVEEVLKGLAVLFYALCISDHRETVLSVSLAVGLGFALLENMVILTGNLETVTVSWAIAQGIGAALMHAACTAMVGMGICYVRKRRKLFYCGTFSLLIAAVIFHGIFNVLVQSAYRYLAFGWSAIMLLPQVVPIIHKKAPAIGPGKI